MVVIKTKKPLRRVFVKGRIDPEASADEFRAVVDEFFVDRRKTQEKLIDARLKMKDLITREEWRAIFSAKE